MSFYNPGSATIFILGIMPRCGTNFLSNLLLIHPECSPTDVVWEDYALAHSDLLRAYSRRVSEHWDPDWGASENTRARFLAALGKGIASFLADGKENMRVVVKTPAVDNIESFFRFFPEASLLILIRDGRAIIESGKQSFGWRHEAALHWLAEAAETVVEFQRRFPPGEHKYRVVKYEDLWLDTSDSMNDLLDFLNLDSTNYEFAAASQLPIRGSSELASGEPESLHWDPVEKDEDFNPLGRYDHWDTFMHFRYQQVAGQSMEALGYPETLIRRTLQHRARSRLLDVAWLLKSAVRPIYRHLRGKIQ